MKRARETVFKPFEGVDEERSAITSAADYSRLRAVRLFALALKLRELGNTDYADAVAAVASQSLDEAVALQSKPQSSQPINVK